MEMSENGVSRGVSDRRSDEAPLSHTSSSGLVELQRRCFSCCNVVLRQEASLTQSQKRVMVRGFESTVVLNCIVLVNPRALSSQSYSLAETA